ncbi:MAG: hypothetical protein JXR76_05965 [Deltaproteobacteria bacterium]|nr:hypothetical protein [Deltaproteobacteria bacterium]
MNTKREPTPRTRRILLLLQLVVVTAWTQACGAPNNTPSSVIVQTDTTSEPTTPDTEANDSDTATSSDDASLSPIAQLVARDAHKARDILIQGLNADDPDIAAWSAIYIRLLRVEADKDQLHKALLSGANSDNLLLQTLCFRWLVNDSGPLPAVSIETADPIVLLFYTLGQMTRNAEVDSMLMSQAIHVGKATKFHDEKIQLNTLLHETAPYDNGPLALGIAFINSRRLEIATEIEGITTPLSARYRGQLLEIFHLSGVAVPTDNDTNRFEFTGTTIHSRLENPLNRQSPAMLRTAVITGKGTLKKSALRALAASALRPEVGDFAAAATAFQTDDAQLRIEAARTYLLLVTRATQKE